MPSKHCRLCPTLVLLVLVAAPLSVRAQQQPTQSQYNAPRRTTAAPSQAQQQRPQQRAGQAVQAAPRSTSPAAPRTAQRGPAQRTPAAGAPASGRAPAAGQRPGQYPVRQTGGSEPLPQNAAPAAQVLPVAPQAPFTLTAQQQALLDQVLRKWEQQSNKVDSFSCTFGRWEVNETFGPPENGYQLSEAFGEIKYNAPDKGSYRITKQTEWDRAQAAYVPRTEGLDHWVCTGTSIFEFNNQKRQLIERELDPSMRGKAITDGPLPFVFGTKADQLKRRYWLRDITPAEEVNQKIRLEAWPKFQRDAANFQHAIIILNQEDFMPWGLRIVLPDGKNKQDYAFENVSVNNPLAIFRNAFSAPIKPLTWTKVFIPAGGAPAPAAEAPAQAQQPQTQR